MTRWPGAGRRVISALPFESVIDSSTWPDARKTTTSPPEPPIRRVSLAARPTARMRLATPRKTPSFSSEKTGEISRIRIRI